MSNQVYTHVNSQWPLDRTYLSNTISPIMVNMTVNLLNTVNIGILREKGVRKSCGEEDQHLKEDKHFVIYWGGEGVRHSNIPTIYILILHTGLFNSLLLTSCSIFMTGLIYALGFMTGRIYVLGFEPGGRITAMSCHDNTCVTQWECIASSDLDGDDILIKFSSFSKVHTLLDRRLITAIAGLQNSRQKVTKEDSPEVPWLRSWKMGL